MYIKRTFPQGPRAKPLLPSYVAGFSEQFNGSLCQLTTHDLRQLIMWSSKDYALQFPPEKQFDECVMLHLCKLAWPTCIVELVEED